MSIEADEHSPLLESRRFDCGDPSRFVDSEILGNVVPLMPTIACHPQGTVIGTDIKHIGITWRFRKSSRRASFGQRDFRRDRLQVVTTIKRPEHIVSRAVKNLRIVVGKDERRVPVKAVADSLNSPWANRGALASFQMTSTDPSVLTLIVDKVGVIRVHSTDKPIASRNRDPIFVNSTTLLADRRTAPRTIVLKSAKHPVGFLGTNRDVIELTDGSSVDMVPIIAVVVGHVETAVSADDHMSAVFGIDPQVVAIRMNTATKVAGERRSTIDRTKLRYTQDVDALIIARVDSNDTKVHWANVQRIDAFPSFTRIVGAIDAAIIGSFRSLLILNVWRLAKIRISVGTQR